MLIRLCTTRLRLAEFQKRLDVTAKRVIDLYIPDISQDRQSCTVVLISFSESAAIESNPTSNRISYSSCSISIPTHVL